eukprot:3953474-Pleurochrysis_carterae.AAC.1
MFSEDSGSDSTWSEGCLLGGWRSIGSLPRSLALPRAAFAPGHALEGGPVRVVHREGGPELGEPDEEQRRQRPAKGAAHKQREPVEGRPARWRARVAVM